MSADQKAPQASAANRPRDLLSMLYREIGFRPSQLRLRRLPASRKSQAKNARIFLQCSAMTRRPSN
jgi:hypothetical protein